MQGTFFPAFVNMRRAGILVSAAVCILLPMVLGAPASDDSLLKQQIADDFWTSLNNQELYSDDPLQRLASQYNVRTRSGLRSIDGMGNDWGDTRGNNWRLGYVGGSPKRGGGLDSLGRTYYGGYTSRRPGWVPTQHYQKRFDSLSGDAFGLQKRNFDEIDRNGFGSFVKRNFDEIDRTGLGFNKRNFDEIDRTQFGSFVKRFVR